MHIYSSVQGNFLEPEEKDGVRDAICFPQFEALNVKEALVLPQMYEVLRSGGVIRATHGLHF